MKKGFKFYDLAWLILFALFNAIVFICPALFKWENKFDGTFWIGYTFITITFIGQLICSYFAFESDSKSKLFLNLPLITISYSALITSIIVGTVCMVSPMLPNWLGIICCFIILGFSAVSVIKAVAAADIVDSIDKKVKSDTNFIKSLTTDAQNLMNRANAPMLKTQCKKVYEALLYSDPVSNEKIVDIEQRIKEEFDALVDAVIADDLNVAESATNEITVLLNIRNKKSTLHK